MIDAEEADVTIEKGQADRCVGKHRLQLGRPFGHPPLQARVELLDLFLGLLPLRNIHQEAVPDNAAVELDLRLRADHPSIHRSPWPGCM